MPRLKSMDVTIHGTTRSFEFDPSIPVDTDDEAEASLAVLADAETTEVVIENDFIESASVSVTVRVVIEVDLDVDMEDLFDHELEDEDGVRDLIERGEYDIESEVSYAIEHGNFTEEEREVTHVVVNDIYDADGNHFEG